jgi:hypothetical protein
MKVIVTLLLLILYVPGYSQGKNSGLSRLKAIFQTADSVLVVSHLATAGIEILDEKTGTYTDPQPLVQDNKLNESIIKKSIRVQQPQLDSLIALLSQPNPTTRTLGSRCFIPHHAIILYHTGNISYIDICFGCYGLRTTLLEKEAIENLDSVKWLALERFFLSYNN